jgi:hypothetical protein
VSLVTGVTGSCHTPNSISPEQGESLENTSYFPNRLYEDRGMVCVTCGGCVTYT